MSKTLICNANRFTTKNATTPAVVIDPKLAWYTQFTLEERIVVITQKSNDMGKTFSIFSINA
jgi:hypothetical protein